MFDSFGTTMREDEVIDELKHTSHHFVELILKRYWKSTSHGRKVIFNILVRVFNSKVGTGCNSFKWLHL